MDINHQGINHLYQELIIDHGTAPRNHHKLQDATCVKEGYNPLCGDQITLYLKIENNMIIHASFEGKGCAISQASASIMAEMLHGKSVRQAEELFEEFQAVMTTNLPFTESLGKLLAFNGVKTFPTRIKCATLAWHTLKAALQQSEQLVTTE